MRVKLTVNLDGELLDRVVKLTGSRTKTQAIMTALRELDRRERLVRHLREGLGAAVHEFKGMFDPAVDPSTQRVAEEGPEYGERDTRVSRSWSIARGTSGHPGVASIPCRHSPRWRRTGRLRFAG